MSKTYGPNMNRLIAHKMAVDAVPSGGGMNDAIKFILGGPKTIADGWRKAAEWCEDAIIAVRCAAEPSPWKNASQEEICAHILSEIEKRKPRVQMPMDHSKRHDTKTML